MVKFNNVAINTAQHLKNGTQVHLLPPYIVFVQRSLLPSEERTRSLQTFWGEPGAASSTLPRTASCFPTSQLALATRRTTGATAISLEPARLRNGGGVLQYCMWCLQGFVDALYRSVSDPLSALLDLFGSSTRVSIPTSVGCPSNAFFVGTYLRAVASSPTSTRRTCFIVCRALQRERGCSVKGSWGAS